MQTTFFDLYVALDFETATGSRSSACQLGMALMRNGEILEQREFLMRPPGNEYNSFTMAVHGITPSRTAYAPSFAHFWPQIKEWVNQYPLVCHNKGFDISVMRSTCAYYGITDFAPIDVHCTYHLTRLKLVDACKAYGVPIGQHHDGLADAIMCGRIYAQYAQQGRAEMAVLEQERQQQQQLKTSLFKQASLSRASFQGKNVLITGVFDSLSRSEVYELCSLHGAVIKKAISRKLDYVILGQRPGPMKVKALKDLKDQGYDIQVLSEADFTAMLS